MSELLSCSEGWQFRKSNLSTLHSGKTTAESLTAHLPLSTVRNLYFTHKAWKDDSSPQWKKNVKIQIVKMYAKNIALQMEHCRSEYIYLQEQFDF